MDARIVELAKTLEAKTIARRRDFHRYAETAWTEFRTASIVADVLTELGYEVLIGDDVVAAEAMMGVPPANELERHRQRALAQGANPVWVEKMLGGKTGVVGVMDFGKPGPTVALRFDIDANDAVEAEDESHRPYRENFASVNKGAMHACAHDGHTAVGLAVAEILAALRADLAGRVKLIFQPAEEGVRGAKAMVVKGVVDDVDYLLGMHFGVTLRKTGQVACQTEGFLATTKLDASFTGVPAHAGAAPETGRNALLAAATALLNLHAISRHSQGASRINVGVMQGGTGRNVIPANAVIKLETRGTTSAINEYMYNEAVRIIEAAAQMHGCQVQIQEMGGAAGCGNDAELVARIRQTAERMGLFKEIVAAGNIGGSEDCTYFMERVQQRGGKAAYVMVGTELAAGHHDFRFDFNEEALVLASAFISGVAADLLTGK
ncbi:amidohydrolase [Sporolituus thermophilus]|uniref:Aminobenzoyl-glutamate utilization protein A n=1 Tax=Sporolituus thermophilus DSM 23256 TaxID=1123285 RepID=A0A1G7LGZ0_9FIRM|nr:amidohydrolase [Sporolituus thermophilus]SDF48280.1 aminobenzoyl-glutamate utilization protein A [Sporolituus thermophilus DSM 23256]